MVRHGHGVSSEWRGRILGHNGRRSQDVNKLINSPQNLGTTAPLDYIHATRSAGYEAIGIRLYRAPGRTYNFNPIDGDAALMRDVKRAIGDLGLEMYDIYSYYLQPEMEWDLILPTFDYAAELGARYVLVIGDDTEWNRMLDNMGRICEKLEPAGIRACIEAYATKLTPLATAIKFCEDCARNHVGMCMDPRQGFRDEGRESNALLKQVDRALLPYAQINDSTPFGTNNGILARRRRGAAVRLPGCAAAGDRPQHRSAVSK